MARNRLHVRKFIVPLVASLSLIAQAALAANIRIVNPQNEETVHDNSGNVTVVVQAELRDRQQVRLLLDGMPAAPDSEDKTFELSGIDRGEHTLEAMLLNDRNEVVAKSGPVTFYMWQASRKFPSRNNP